MNGLRVYINPVNGNAQNGQQVFYSRRADGPYYRWHYQDEFGRWRSARDHLSNMTLRGLAIARWDSVPKALQVKLGEHYLD